MINRLDGMFDLEDVNVSVLVSDGRKMTTKKVGKYSGTIINSEGKDKRITLTNVSHVPELMVNLFSLTAVVDKGCHVPGTKEGIDIQKGQWQVKLDKSFGTPKGHVFGATIVPEKECEMAQLNLQKQIEYEKAHQLVGHPEIN